MHVVVDFSLGVGRGAEERGGGFGLSFKKACQSNTGSTA